MPGPLQGLKDAIEQRKQAQSAASGGLDGLGGVPMPPSAPQTPAPATNPMGGLMAAAPAGQAMPPDQRQQFTQDTGIAPNLGATDINLGVDPVELARRADALINQYTPAAQPAAPMSPGWWAQTDKLYKR